MLGPASLVIPLAMTVALLIDAVLGEPPSPLHPVVWMGTFLNRWGRGLPDRGGSWEPFHARALLGR